MDRNTNTDKPSSEHYSHLLTLEFEDKHPRASATSIVHGGPVHQQCDLVLAERRLLSLKPQHSQQHYAPSRYISSDVQSYRSEHKRGIKENTLLNVHSYNLLTALLLHFTFYKFIQVCPLNVNKEIFPCITHTCMYF